MDKRMKQVTITLFIAYIFLGMGAHLVIKDRSFSSLENKLLAQFPNFTWSSFQDGTFGKDFEVYIAEQFPFRDWWISVKSRMELAMGRTDQKGVFIGQDGYLLQDFKTPDLVLQAKIIEKINSFAKEHQTYVALAPTATSIYERKLPLFASPSSELDYLKQVAEGLSQDSYFVDLSSNLQKHKQEELYYKTDHHWTTLGAYYAYLSIAGSLGIDPLELDDFIVESVSDNFYGSLFSKGNFTFLKPDSMALFHPKQPVAVEVNYVAEQKTTDSLYAWERLAEKDQYRVFLDGNHPVVQIKTSVHNGKKIAIMKDSYANSMVPFLVNHFQEIHLLDYRFLNMPVGQYMMDNDLSELLILYNVQNFAEEKAFSWLY